MQAHKSVCRYGIVMCPNTNCKQVVTRADMDKHLETCAFSPTTCGWCSKSIPKCEIEVGTILHLTFLHAYYVNVYYEREANGDIA